MKAFECLTGLLDFAHCAPDGPAFDVPGVDMTTFYALTDPVVKQTAAAAFASAARAAALHVQELFLDGVNARFSFCPGEYNVALFAAPDFAGPTAPAGEFAVAFPIRSNFVFLLKNFWFWAAGDGEITVTVKVVTDDGGVENVYSGVYPVIAGKNELGINPLRITTHYPVGGKIIVEWTGDGVQGLFAPGMNALPACGCTAAATGSYGLVFFGKAECDVEGFVCANAEKFAYAMTLGVAYYIYSAAAVGTRLNALMSVKNDQKEVFRAETLERLKKEAKRLADFITPACNDCCFRPAPPVELVWKT